MRRLIICADGTWNSRERGKPTNVQKMAQAILPAAADGTPQLVFYDAGVGTGIGLDRILGGAFGYGLSRNVEDAYRFLVDNYVEGDEVYFFGFSRGAFTARSTVGLIRKCDLLTKAHADLFPEAYAIYREREGGADSPRAVAFRNRYASPIKVTCLGVWDTVGSLGIPGHLGDNFVGRAINRDYQFHDVKISSRTVEAGYQALAIDEQRRPFEPAVWWREHVSTQALEQAWFPGAHSDVGGGNDTLEESAERGSLADVAFMWMVERARRHGLEFSDAYLAERIHPNALAPLHPSRNGIYKLTPPRVRPMLALPEDPALHETLDARRRDFPGIDPVAHPPRIESPQAIHPSAWERVDALEDYRPANLMAHVATRTASSANDAAA
jgi:uncharacterized protein (DUF2235 family)